MTTVTPAPRMARHTVEVSRFAALPVLTAVGALAATLIVCAGKYGYHRDELYFRMLPPAWGYVDQPPLTPFLARTFSQLLADEVWGVRIPAILFAVTSVLVIALVTREVGGSSLAQGLAAWGYAFASITLSMGHVLLTASFDLLVWPAVILAVMRALLRNQPWWWLIAGAIVGLSMYNKLLIGMLLVSLAVGLVAVGPRRVIWSKWVLGAVVLALLLGLPNIIYQATNGWSQLLMGATLSAHNGDSVRIMMWPLLLLLLGPPLVPFWIAGIIALGRRRQWRPIRSLAVAFPVLLVLVWIAGAQFYYPYGMLAVLYAIGCVPVAQFAQQGSPRKALVIAAVALNSLVCAVISLPILPLSVLGSTPIPGINMTAADQIGWPVYVKQVDQVADGLGTHEGVAILVSNYGEAGALARYGDTRQPAVFSGQNALYTLGPPPASARTAFVVGGMLPRVSSYFRSCTIVARLDNGVGVDNEEEGQPIAVCRDRLESWTAIWPALKHLD
jgi:4-amino-4-deoxy-L-arabinose transferase-like glycosyltransferase